MAHKHTVRDTGAHFTIDPFTRQVKNDSTTKTTIVQFDHNSERLTFELPVLDGHAATLCDLIEIHYINISADGKKQNAGVYEVDDIKADGEKTVFTWLISQEATQLAGSLNFFIVLKCTENGVTVYRWGTEIFKNLPVSDGMNNGEAVLTEYPDILAQWKTQLFDASATAVSNVATAEANALAAIEAAGEAKKQAVLASIPDEYEALSALADQSHRNKAGAIVVKGEGESIILNDASEYPLQNLKLFGKSTQDGTPTPDAPADIVGVAKPVVTVCGKNLLKNEAVTSSAAGIAFTVNADGSVTANGTSTAVAPLLICKSFLFKAGVTYKLTGCPVGGSTSTYRIDDVGKLFDDGEGGSITHATDTYAQIRIRIAPNVTVENLTFYPMIRVASVGDDTYEQYAQQTVETVNSLHGIPVSNGGNYTDANGQQWICDEVDLARGVYVQRCFKETPLFSPQDGLNRYSAALTHKANANCAEELGIPVLCETLSFNANAGSGTPVANGIRIAATSPKYVIARYNEEVIESATVLYPLETPIETLLSEAEINAFKALHSNKPNTTVQNDAGAYMAIEYVADTKTYIDNKIAEALKGSD